MDRLTHVDESGAARMVDVSGKAVTAREATATGRVLVAPEVVALLRGEGVPKGDALAVARIAGIMGAKHTPTLIPLCHPLAISGVTVDLAVADDAVEITAGELKDKVHNAVGSPHFQLKGAVRGGTVVIKRKR